MQSVMCNNRPEEIEKQRITIGMKCLDIIILWYYFFSPSMVLRPFPSIMWVIIAISGLIVFRCRWIHLETYFILSMFAVFALFITSLLSVDMGASLKYTLSIFLYMLIAYEICSNYDNILFFVKMAVPFVLIHFLATTIQIVNIDIYRTIFLPLLPNEFHYRILAFASRFAYTGFTNQTSTNADFLSLGIGIFVFRTIAYPRAKKGISITLILGLVALVAMTERRWSTIVVLVLLLIAILTQVSNKALKSVIILLIIVLSFTGVFSSLSVFQGVLGKMQFEIQSGDVTNGRNTIWRDTWAFISQKPFWGYGADSFRVLMPSEANAHNSFLQTILEMGFLGAVVFYAPFVYALFKSLNHLKDGQLLTIDARDKAIVFFSIYWQSYSFLDSIFESYFNAELSVFMLFVAQFMMLRILEKNSYQDTSE